MFNATAFQAATKPLIKSHWMMENKPWQKAFIAKKQIISVCMAKRPHSENSIFVETFGKE